MKIKLTNVALLIGSIALIANIGLGVVYFQQRSEKESLISELADVQQSFNEYNMTNDLKNQIADAETRLEEAQQASIDARLTAEQAYSKENLSNGGILDGVLQLAQHNHLNVIHLSTKPDGNEIREGHTYSTLVVDMRVSGSLPNLAVFASKLENGAIKAVTIDDISISSSSDAYAATLNFSVFYPVNIEL
ncbi:MAG: hypothetical protein SVO26_04430 [Chloroflexota bacterium]|nr:hypothetical protein [Chloroflexota bacterium]